MSSGAVIFDLDGTLVDSSPGILAAYASAFASCGLTPKVPLTAQVIGPPLRATLSQLSHSVNPDQLDRLTAGFKMFYDSAGCLETRPFAGVNKMLNELRDGGVPMHIATNKRALPTNRIVDHLGWQHMFESVYALDSVVPPAQNKSMLLSRLIVDAALDRSQTIYVGDRYEDGEAATQNAVTFIWVAWGFDFEKHRSDNKNWMVVSNPVELASALMHQRTGSVK
jgi:phosphoglycolate phosphatase